MTLARCITLSVTTVALAVSAATPAALAKGDDDVRATGTCSASSQSKLKLSPEDGGLEVELEIDENRSGRVWDVTIRRNGTRIVKRRATTRGASGSFEVRKVTGDSAGRDTVKATATSRRTGETCRVTAAI